jgi:hypothetical protein
MHVMRRSLAQRRLHHQPAACYAAVLPYDMQSADSFAASHC